MDVLVLEEKEADQFEEKFGFEFSKEFLDAEEVRKVHGEDFYVGYAVGANNDRYLTNMLAEIDKSFDEVLEEVRKK